MGDRHSRSFFGQNASIIINSPKLDDDFIFIRCLKKKSDGSWEKPSQGEGKVIKISLDEIVMILRVLNRVLPKWNTYHNYKDQKTQISFAWGKKGEEGKDDTLWVNIANYSKMINSAQAEIIKLLLEHILQEKIANATGYKDANNKVMQYWYDVPDHDTRLIVLYDKVDNHIHTAYPES